LLIEMAQTWARLAEQERVKSQDETLEKLSW